MTFHHIEELGDQGGKSSLHGLNWRQKVRGGGGGVIAHNFDTGLEHLL